METILEGLLYVFAIENILFMFIGVFIGIIFGAIPGLTGGVAIVVLLPVTYAMDPMAGILMLLGIYNGGTYGGSISAILLGTPGTAGAAATILDGNALAKRGYPNKALNMALYASVAGGIIGSLILLFGAPIIAEYAIKLGPPEYFAIALMGLAIVAGVGGKNMLTGFSCASLGMLLSTVGMSKLTGTLRYTFDKVELMSGLGTLPVLLGIFALTMVFKNLTSKRNTDVLKTGEIVSSKDDVLTLGMFKKTIKTVSKSSIIGSFIGLIPGAGVVIASFLSYTVAKSSSKNPESFGKGNLQGIAAPETANNAVCASSFVPLLTLGIPGSVIAAILLGSLTMHGIVPGPMMIKQQGGYFYGIILGFIVIQLIILLESKVLIKVFKNIVKVPIDILMPILLITCSIGMFSYQQRISDVAIFFTLGFIYYFLMKVGASGPPFVLGFILGPILEFNLDGALIMGKGSWTIFFTRPISLIFIIISVIIFITMYRQDKKSSKVIKEDLDKSSDVENEGKEDYEEV